MTVKKQVSLFSLFLCMFNLYSCQEKNESSYDTVYYDSEVLSAAQPLKVDYLFDKKNLMGSKGAFVFSDTVIITNNYENQEKGFISIYDKDFHLQKDYFKYGNGPFEFLQPDVYMNNGLLMVNDKMKAQLACIDIKKVVEKEQHTPTIIKYKDNWTNAVNQYNDSTLVLADPFYFKNKEMNINQGDSRLIVTDGAEPSYSTKKHNYFTMNVSGQGYVVANKDKTRFLYADKDNSVLEIYNNNLAMIKKVIGPVSFTVKYRLDKIPDSDMQEIIYASDIPTAYGGFCNDESYVYFIYFGEYWKGGKSKIEDFKSYILKFDWEGNFVKSYVFPKYIFNLSKGKEENVFYATFQDLDGNINLARLNTDE